MLKKMVSRLFKKQPDYEKLFKRSKKLHENTQVVNESLRERLKKYEDIGLQDLVREQIGSVKPGGVFYAFSEEEGRKMMEVGKNIWSMEGFHKIVDKLLESQIHKGFNEIPVHDNRALVSYATVNGIRLLYDEIKDLNKKYHMRQSPGEEDYDEHDVI